MEINVLLEQVFLVYIVKFWGIFKVSVEFKKVFKCDLFQVEFKYRVLEEIF